MSILELFITLAVIVLPLLWLTVLARRNLRLFSIVVENGRLTQVRGRLPQRLFDDILDVIAREKPNQLRLVCRIEGGQAVLDFSEGTDLGLRQVFRNLVGEYPALRLKQASRVRSRQ